MDNLTLFSAGTLPPTYEPEDMSGIFRQQLAVAVPVPLRQGFSYLPLPNDPDARLLEPGSRVRISFGHQKRLVGVVRSINEIDPNKETIACKPILDVIDHCALLPKDLLALGEFASKYYHYPIGEVFHSFLPSLLSKGEPATIRPNNGWALSAEGRALCADDFKRSPRQQEVWEKLNHAGIVSRDQMNELPNGWRPAMKRLKEKGLVEIQALDYSPVTPDVGPTLTDEQQLAVDTLTELLGGYTPVLLEGVTGSGKTEVYLNLVTEVLKNNGQVLIMVPEIGLTPQLARRFVRRLPVEVVILHSGLSERQRMDGYLKAANGTARVVIGTRSSLFTPLPDIQLIIIDEEHDASLIQHEGFRYNARDLALYRGRLRQVPVVLGSATPSLDTLKHVMDGRFEHLRLTRRPGAAKPPIVHTIDVKGQHLKHGLSQILITEINDCLARGEQALVFLNRRGYAKVLLCDQCGHSHICHQCDNPMTVHRRKQQLRCHLCGDYTHVPLKCPQCQTKYAERHHKGVGTERLDKALKELFPDFPILRVDRDTTRTRDAMEDRLAIAREGKPCVLVGTQMLAKGHDLPNLTIVGVVNADAGLFSHDFRAPEQLAQLLIQVSGRAGRADKKGHVYIQTRVPDHPLLVTLLTHGYHACAEQLLVERAEAGLPPHKHLATLRVQCADKYMLELFCEAITRKLQLYTGVESTGFNPALKERIGGRWRYQLGLLSYDRATLHAVINTWLPEIASVVKPRGLRWQIDVDPLES